MDTEVICMGISAADVLVSGLADMEFGEHTTFAREIVMKPGGDAVNEAITLAALGHRTQLMTLVGKDSAGDFLKKTCQEEGVITEGIATAGDLPTTTSIVLITKDGERRFLSGRRSTAKEYDIIHMDLSLIRPGVKVFSLASLFCSRRLNGPELLAILRRVKAAGAVTVADMVLDRPECTLEGIREALPYLDYVIPSLDEARHFTGKTEVPDIVEVFQSYGVKNVVIKLGADGVYGSDGKDTVWVPSMAEKVVDTTGAGDNFAAGFISGLIRDLSLEECMRFGSAVSAIAIGQTGATGAVKSREQAERFLAEQKRVIQRI